MTIHLDNGTTIELSKDIISITNNDRGFTWDFQSNELHRATDTIEIRPSRALDITKVTGELQVAMDYWLHMLGTYVADGEHFGNLKKEDLNCPRTVLENGVNADW